MIILTVIKWFLAGALARVLWGAWHAPVVNREPPPSTYQLRQEAALRAAQEACANFREKS